MGASGQDGTLSRSAGQGEKLSFVASANEVFLSVGRSHGVFSQERGHLIEVLTLKESYYLGCVYFSRSLIFVNPLHGSSASKKPRRSFHGNTYLHEGRARQRQKPP